LILFVLYMFGVGISNSTGMLINFIWGFLLILYILYDFSVIKKSDTYLSTTEENIRNNYVLMFGFKLLIDLVGLLWHVVRMFYIFKR
jgi:FtsH-binding integral membrane protein